MISVDKIVTHKKALLQSEIDKWEQVIDRQLTERYTRGGDVWIDFSGSNDLYLALRDKYAEGGWSVAYESTCRNESYLKFRAAR